MKKIIALIIAVTAVMLVSATVFAGEIILNEDFSSGLSEWTVTTSDGGSITSEAGSMSLKANGSTGIQQARKTIGSITDNSVFEFRVMLNATVDNKGLTVALYNGVTRAFMRIYSNKFMINTSGNPLTVNEAHEEGVWYTYYVVITNSGKTADIYRRADGQSDMSNIASGVALQANTGTRIDIFIESSEEMAAQVDYIRYYTEGMHIMEKSFSSGGLKITAIPNGELTAECNITHSGSGSETATVILIVFDAEGMIRAMDMQRQEFTGFSNEAIKVTVDLSEQYQSVKNGSAELYVWDSVEGMQPLCTLSSI